MHSTDEAVELTRDLDKRIELDPTKTACDYYMELMQPLTPSRLIKGLEEKFGCPLADYDFNKVGSYPTFTISGNEAATKPEYVSGVPVVDTTFEFELYKPFKVNVDGLIDGPDPYVEKYYQPQVY